MVGLYRHKDTALAGRLREVRSGGQTGKPDPAAAFVTAVAEADSLYADGRLVLNVKPHAVGPGSGALTTDRRAGFR